MEKQPTVLVIDDEPVVLRVVTLVLQDSGIRVISMPDGESASQFLESSRPDMVISDVRLPGMDGVAITRRIKSDPEMASIPVLLISAFGEPRGHLADAFLAKPFDIDQLTERVCTFLRSSRDS